MDDIPNPLIVLKQVAYHLGYTPTPDDPPDEDEDAENNNPPPEKAEKIHNPSKLIPALQFFYFILFYISIVCYVLIAMQMRWTGAPFTIRYSDLLVGNGSFGMGKAFKRFMDRFGVRIYSTLTTASIGAGGFGAQLKGKPFYLDHPSLGVFVFTELTIFCLMDTIMLFAFFTTDGIFQDVLPHKLAVAIASTRGLTLVVLLIGSQVYYRRSIAYGALDTKIIVLSIYYLITIPYTVRNIVFFLINDKYPARDGGASDKQIRFALVWVGILNFVTFLTGAFLMIRWGRCFKWSIPNKISGLDEKAMVVKKVGALKMTAAWALVIVSAGAFGYLFYTRTTLLTAADYAKLGNWNKMGPNIRADFFCCTEDEIGESISMNADGTRIAIAEKSGEMGATSQVKVLEFDGTTMSWTQLGDSIGTLFQYVESVSMSGDGNTVIFGVPHSNQNKGYIRSYRYDVDSQWKQVGDIIAQGTPGAEFGFSTAVSSDGRFLVAGSPSYDIQVAQSSVVGESQPDAGQVSVFERQMSQGGRNRYRSFRQRMLGNSSFDAFGRKVAMNAGGDRVAIGSSHDAKDARQNYEFSSGRVQAMKFDGNAWVPMGQLLKSEDVNIIDRFGLAVDMDEKGTRIAVGAAMGSSGNNGRGNVQVYEYNEGNDLWVQLGKTIVGFNHTDMFGATVSLSGNRIMISFLDLFEPSSPALLIYEFNATNEWDVVGTKIKGESTSRYNATIDQHNNYLTNNGTILAVAIKQTAEDRRSQTYVRVYEHLPVDSSL
eukprot:scaffold17125_cov50-Attheya_sp.AAC.1